MSNTKSQECLDPYNFTSIASPIASSNWFAIVVANRKILSVENIDLKIDYFLVKMPSDSVLLTWHIENKITLFSLRYGRISYGYTENEQLVACCLREKKSGNTEAVTLRAPETPVVL